MDGKCNDALIVHLRGSLMPTRTELMEHVITLYDSGVLKDRIAETLNITRNDVDDIIAHRCVFGGLEQ